MAISILQSPRSSSTFYILPFSSSYGCLRCYHGRCHWDNFNFFHKHTSVYLVWLEIYLRLFTSWLGNLFQTRPLSTFGSQPNRIDTVWNCNFGKCLLSLSFVSPQPKIIVECPANSKINEKFTCEKKCVSWNIMKPTIFNAGQRQRVNFSHVQKICPKSFCQSLYKLILRPVSSAFIGVWRSLLLSVFLSYVCRGQSQSHHLQTAHKVHLP